MDEWVIVDTCIWTSFFGKPGSPEKLAVDKLIDMDRIALVGPILAEGAGAPIAEYRESTGPKPGGRLPAVAV